VENHRENPNNDRMVAIELRLSDSFFSGLFGYEVLTLSCEYLMPLAKARKVDLGLIVAAVIRVTSGKQVGAAPTQGFPKRVLPKTVGHQYLPSRNPLPADSSFKSAKAELS
jgi:hypothetical protein